MTRKQEIRRRIDAELRRTLRSRMRIERELELLARATRKRAKT